MLFTVGGNETIGKRGKAREVGGTAREFVGGQ
jgi:hypothetical protein